MVDTHALGYFQCILVSTDVGEEPVLFLQVLDKLKDACCGTSDGIASWRTMQSRLESLSALGIPTEFHSYNGLPHGFGLGTGTVAEGWINDAVHFWQSQSGATAIQSPPRHSERGLGGEAYSLNGIRHNSLQSGMNIVDGRKVVILKYSAKRQ